MGRLSNIGDKETWQDKLQYFIHKLFHYKKRLEKAEDSYWGRDMVVCDHKNCYWDYEK